MFAKWSETKEIMPDFVKWGNGEVKAPLLLFQIPPCLQLYIQRQQTNISLNLTMTLSAAKLQSFICLFFD